MEKLIFVAKINTMKRFLHFFCFILFITGCYAQKYLRPVFDRTDTPTFHLDSVEITKDSTFLFFTYEAESGTWANISDKTYLENVRNGERFPIVKVSGIPFGPEKRHFTDTEEVDVVLCFPPVATDKINIIENEENKSFNIYGIDLNNSYQSTYSADDIEYYFTSSHKNQEEENWMSALEYTQKQLYASNYVEGIQSFASACSMYNLTMVYFGIKDYEKMIEWGKKAIGILNALPRDSIYMDVLARTYGNVSTAYYLKKENETADFYRELSLATRRMGDGIGVVSYERYLQNMARDYYYEDNFPKALLYGKEVVDIYRKKYNQNNFEYGCAYVNSLSNMCEFCQRMGKFEEALVYGEQALSLIENGVCQDSISSWLKNTIYINLAVAKVTLGEKDDAIKFLEDVISDNPGMGRERINARMLLAEILLNVKQDSLRTLKEYNSLVETLSDSIVKSKKYYTDYIELLHKLYRYYEGIDSNLALQYLKRHISATKGYRGEESVSFANACLKYLNDINFFSKSLTGEPNEKDTLFYYLKQSSEIIKRHICSSVYTMSNSERTNYWQRFKYLYSWLIPTVCTFMGGTKEANSLAYDASLFYKGMLLSAENEFKDVILSSQDTLIVSLYNSYMHNLSLLETPSPIFSKAYSDSIKSVLREQEFSLTQKVTRYNKMYKGTNYSWKEIKNKLNDEDVAIEITSYLSIDGSKVYYDAYVIDCELDAPIILFLFDEDQIRDCIQNDSIDYYGLSKLIWGNKHLLSTIKDKKNIFVSASGLLNSIAFEYLPLENGQYIFDHYNIYRLSSTRELYSIRTPIQLNNVILYGGLDYNNRTSEIKVCNTAQTNQVSRSVVDSLITRGGLDPLIGSKQEVEEVKNEMLRHNIDCILYTDSEGTEESFKELSGSQINIIHLSTHGMYVPVEEQKDSSNPSYHFILSDDYSDVDEEAILLSHSLLVMSGSNILIHNDCGFANKEDGILTALEISHLDFNDLDLVVLSACETGLGEIDSEGVYGLQRAFKKAGANSILMSLNKIDDEATRILMVEFYKNLMSGKTKLQSLKDAQHHLRTIENGKYDDPKYWASFIMLDGLN